MELASKVIAPQSVEPGSNSLPGSDTQSVRESIKSAHLSQSGVGASPTSPPTTQVLITIMHRVAISPAPTTVSGHRNATATDALVDAILRLRDHGIVIGNIDKGPHFPSGPVATGAHYQPQPHHREFRYRHQHRSPDMRQDARVAEGQQREDRQTRDQGDRAPREEARTSRPETPAEQKIRELIERAIARHQERSVDATTTVERPSTPPNSDTVNTQRPGAQQSPPTIDIERSPRIPEPIVTPPIRDALNDPRNDTARLIQQLLANDPSASRPQTPPPSEAIQSQTIHPSLSDARAGVNERLTQLRDALQVTIERSSPQPITSPEQNPLPSHSVANQGDFTRFETTFYGARPTTTVQSEGRSAPDITRPVSVDTNPSAGQTSTAQSPTGAIRPVGQPREDTAALNQEKANNLLEALSKAAQKIVSVENLRRLEAAAETAVLTAAAAIALGVMGSEIVLKEIVALSEEFLKRLRGQSPDGEKEVVKLEELIRQLEEQCADRGVETITQPAGLVADIPGTIKDDATGAPLEGIEVDGGALGITYTDAQGNFIFKNVPLEEGFAIVARTINYSFFPCPAIGTVSAATYLTIFGKRTQ